MTTFERDWVRVLRAVNYRVRSGRPFTVDSIWPRLDDIQPAAHKARLGRHIQAMRDAGTIQWVGWATTDRGMKHARPVSIWQAAAAQGQDAA